MHLSIPYTFESTSVSPGGSFALLSDFSHGGQSRGHGGSRDHGWTWKTAATLGVTLKKNVTPKLGSSTSYCGLSHHSYFRYRVSWTSQVPSRQPTCIT